MTDLDPRWRSIALAAADAAAAVTRRWFRSLAAVEHKPEASSPIVTIADRQAEQAMRAILSDRLPDHGIFGEEEGATNADARYTWVLDPIDGTIAFASGKPLYTTLIALCEDQRPVLSVIDQPILGERWVGSGGETTLNGSPTVIRPVARLSEARLGSTTPGPLMTAGVWEAFSRVQSAVHVTTWGGDAYNYALLSSGHLHLVVENELEWYDWAALVPVVEGAGGIITDWSGAPLGETAGRSQVLAAASPALHAAALACLQSAS
ncbi:MAG: inositol monophosphatase family protein [Myxococcota bacterium]